MNQELTFGRFHYNLPHPKDDMQKLRMASGCCGLSEHYDKILRAGVSSEEFIQAAREINRQMPQVRLHLLTYFSSEDTGFVIGELLEIQHWLNVKSVMGYDRQHPFMS